MKTWLRMLRAELPVLRDLPDVGEWSLPRVQVSLGRTVPGWAIRAVAVILIAVLLVIATGRVGMDAGFAGMILVVAVAVMALRPSAALAQTAIVVSGILIGLDAHGPFDPVVFALIPLAYVVVRFAWWAQVVSLSARVEVGALVRGAWRGLALVGGTVAVGALIFLVAGQPLGLAVVIGGAALVVLAGLLFAGRE